MQHVQPHTSKGPAEWFTGDVHPTSFWPAKTHRMFVWAPSTSHLVHGPHGTPTP